MSLKGAEKRIWPTRASESFLPLRARG